MENLTKTEIEFLNNYFKNVGKIWTEYFDGKSTMGMFRMSQTKREFYLNEYRSELNKIRRKLIENHLVEAVLVLPQDMFYTTNISVTLWILNRNKKAQIKTIGEEKRNYRNREGEILFMDLRQMGEPFEKKFIQFSEADIKKVVNTYHQWQQQKVENVAEYCYSASLEEVILFNCLLIQIWR